MIILKNYFYTILLIFLSPIFTGAQMFLTNDLYKNYDNYKVDQVASKRINFEMMDSLLTQITYNDLFTVKKIGQSLEGRDIKIVSFGKGKINVLGWSQMHGDESTATMALLDILNFLRQDDDYRSFRKTLAEKLTIHFIPMLNPDGAERYRRRNAMDIDLNRDALRLQFPESQALRNIQDSLKPLFGFNLHDQDQRYTAGKTHKSATISFLAPAFNQAKDINEIRENAMKVIVNMHDELSRFIPGHIAKYDDEFEPRAFGDNFAKWGTGTILIESGGWKNNFEKQFLRKLNFVGILIGLQSMAQEKYKDADIETYNKIPENRKYLFDLLIRNLSRKYDNKYYKIDLGINLQEIPTENNRDEYYKGFIEDVGDLSTFFGYEELNCEGMLVEEGKVYDKIFQDVEEIEKIDFEELHKQGITAIRLKNYQNTTSKVDYPINILAENASFTNKFGINLPANFVIKEKNEVRFIIINGFYIDLKSGKSTFLNGVFLK